jgi:hypothetical protein
VESVSQEGKEYGKTYEHDDYDFILLAQVSHRTLSYVHCHLFDAVSTFIFTLHRLVEEESKTKSYDRCCGHKPENGWYVLHINIG